MMYIEYSDGCKVNEGNLKNRTNMKSHLLKALVYKTKLAASLQHCTQIGSCLQDNIELC